MQSLALRRGSGGRCLPFEEVCLGWEIISWAALEFCYCDGVLPHVKSLPIFRNLQLLGKGTGEAKASTWQRSWASVLRALAWPGRPSKVGTGVQEPAEEVSGHWHSQQGTAEPRNDSPGSCWVILIFWLFLCHHPPDSAKATHLPNSNCAVETQSRQGRRSEVLNRWCLPLNFRVTPWFGVMCQQEAKRINV